jgi:hypothetical protein
MTPMNPDAPELVFASRSSFREWLVAHGTPLLGWPRQFGGAKSVCTGHTV